MLPSPFLKALQRCSYKKIIFLSPGLISIMRGCTGAYACTQASSESRLSLYEDVLSSDLACPATVMQIRHGSITG